MLHQRIALPPGRSGPAFDLEQAQRAPVPQQVAEPAPDAVRTGLRWLLQLAGNVLGGGALLAALLAAPAVAACLLGLI